MVSCEGVTSQLPSNENINMEIHTIWSCNLASKDKLMRLRKYCSEKLSAWISDSLICTFSYNL